MGFLGVLFRVLLPLRIYSRLWRGKVGVGDGAYALGFRNVFIASAVSYVRL